MGYFKTVLFFIILTISTSAQEVVRNLNKDWQFKGTDTLSWMPASVPGTVHTDLLTNGIIGDPFKDNNEVKQQWIENENWEYRCIFNVEEDLISSHHQFLNFKGLDTYADVYLNGKLILEANNMFRSWKVNIDEFVQIGKNEMRIVFTSPINENTRNAKYYTPLPGGSDTTAFPVAPFTRKAAYHFGWDWAPRFVTSGIWKDIELVHWKNYRLEDLAYSYLLEGNHAKIVAEIIINSDVETDLKCYLNEHEFELSLEKGENEIEFEFEQEKIERWWPNGSGSQKLYDFKFGFFQNGKLLTPVDEQKIGFRTVELINKPDSIGTSFYFKVNNEPLFMKGANYVPQDVFLPRVKSEQYKHLLTLVRDAGMNMLRVWGGGVYERELFYDLCDEYGILVWQDFMFANTVYPAKLSFDFNAEQEITEQIKRLKKHTCLALWCGNNEIEVAWKNWGWQNQYNYSEKDSTRLWDYYVSFFQKKIPEAVEYLDGNTPYVSTSPQSNWGTTENFNHGSMHYWGVWHGPDDFSGFSQNVGRFMVEWGFQSFPDYELLAQYVSPSQLSLKSEVMINRQKSYVGNDKISEFLSQYALYGGPASSLTFQDYIYNSQWVQALAYQQALEAHLKAQPHCMGTLLWQLNDCWPGPSWSIINYDGTPKKAYWEVKKVISR